MKKKDEMFLTDWPVSFKEIEKVEIENVFARIFYHSFFSLLNLPEKLGSTFVKNCKQALAIFL